MELKAWQTGRRRFDTKVVFGILPIPTVCHIHNMQHTCEDWEVVGHDDKTLEDLAALLVGELSVVGIMDSPGKLDVQTHDVSLEASHQFLILADSGDFVVAHDGEYHFPVARDDDKTIVVV